MIYAQTRILFRNDAHKVLWGFEIQTNHVIPARRPDEVLIKKKKKEFDIQRTLPISTSKNNMKILLITLFVM